MSHSADLGNGVTAHYNSDFTGPVRIVASKWEVAGSSVEVELSGEELIRFVLDELRKRTIANLENMSCRELEAWITIGREE